jgi:hypothetical protein
MKQILKNKINGWLVLITLMVFIVFTATVLPYEAARGLEAGLSESIDTSFLYSPNDLYRIIDLYTRQVRLAYIYQRFSFDLVWPLIYGLFIITTTTYLLQKLNNNNLFKLIYFPIFAVLFDFLENICVSLLMFIYPTRLNLVAYLASIFTSLKWLTLTYSFIQILFLIVVLIIIKLKKK